MNDRINAAGDLKKTEILIVRTGVANTASVVAGLIRLGYAPKLTEDPSDIVEAKGIVIPGVGAFSGAIEYLRSRGLDKALQHRISEGQPTLAICLGMQMLFDWSDESPLTAGLGLIPGKITRFPTDVIVPQIGWNYVEASPECRLLCSGFAYFANSYRAIGVPPDWTQATASHGGTFIAGIEKGAVLGCQFHPELSGKWGRELLGRWLNCAETGSNPEARGGNVNA